MSNPEEQFDPRTGVRYSMIGSLPQFRLGLPAWILVAGLIVAALVILVPLVILFLLAFIAAAIVVVALWVIFLLIRLPFRILGMLLRPRVDDGRRNVRIIVRQ